MNTLLIYPEFPDTFWSYKHALKFVRKQSAFPPLGLLTVASLMPSRWKKRLVDLNVRKLTEADLAWADCAFISGMVVQREAAREVIARCKTAGLKVVAGGPLFTIEHEEFKEVDHFVLNEAEVTLPLFLADLEKGTPRRIYTSTEFADIRKTPAPLWKLCDLDRYASMSIQSCRGCPHQCDFCNVTALFGHRMRTKTADQIVTELDLLYKQGWRRSIFFVDDNFIGNRGYLKRVLLPRLIEWRKGKEGMTFFTEASMNLADDEELLNLMAEAGFDMVFIGIETPDEESLGECRKKQNQNRDLVADVKRIQRAGMQVQAGFIVGFDHDTPSIFRRQIEFIQKSGIVAAMVGLLQAPPGTKLYERLEQAGRLRGVTTGDNVDGTTNIITHLSLDKLREGYKSILEHIYSPEHYYERIKTFLEEYKAPKIRGRLQIEDIHAFFASIFHLGILGKERVHYWKLLLWVKLHRPELIQVAVTLAISGYHFRKICELHVL